MAPKFSFYFYNFVETPKKKHLQNGALLLFVVFGGCVLGQHSENFISRGILVISGSTGARVSRPIYKAFWIRLCAWCVCVGSVRLDSLSRLCARTLFLFSLLCCCWFSVSLCQSLWSFLSLLVGLAVDFSLDLLLVAANLFDLRPSLALCYNHSLLLLLYLNHHSCSLSTSVYLLLSSAFL